MILQTKIPLTKQAHNQIDYQSDILLLGSCFAAHIGKKMEYYKFQNVINPLGILFNPKSIENLVLKAINKETYTKEDVFFLNERWHCFDAHSNLSNSSKEELLSTLNGSIELTNQQINKSTHFIITLGTAWVYRHIETDAIVANCHKVPQKKFLKELLSVNEISESLESIIALAKSVNPKISIIFTVSPVRHLKDGFIENSRSKAHLLSAVHEVVEPRKNVHYFPAYELMMDELRDYRFYTEDMIHPNNLAINYIWKRFKEVWVNNEALKIMEEVGTIQKGLAHKPFNSKSKQHQDFLLKLNKSIGSLRERFSHMNF